MTVKVKFFASLRETLNQSELDVDSTQASTVAEIWQLAAGDMSMPDNTVCAVNQTHAGLDHQVADGDEVAFFPPVTGG